MRKLGLSDTKICEYLDLSLEEISNEKLWFYTGDRRSSRSGFLASTRQLPIKLSLTLG
jgi:hypothetical protein